MREQERAEGLVGAQLITNQGHYLSAGSEHLVAVGLRTVARHDHSHPSSSFRCRVRMGFMKCRHTISHPILASSLLPCGSCYHQVDRSFDRYGISWLPAHALVVA